MHMWNFARTQPWVSQRSEIETSDDRDLGQILGKLFEPLEPQTPRREYIEALPVASVVPAETDDAVQFEEPEELTESAA